MQHCNYENRQGLARVAEGPFSFETEIGQFTLMPVYGMNSETGYMTKCFVLHSINDFKLESIGNYACLSCSETWVTVQS